MNIRRMMVALGAAAVIGAGGCGGDIAQQLVSNEQLRTQVFDALAQHKDLAFQAVDKFMAADTLRAQIVDHMLKNNDAAKQVLIRIGTTPGAMDMVLRIAAQDSSSRGLIMVAANRIAAAAAAPAKR